MKRVDVVNQFITEATTLQEQINALNNRAIPAFRLGNKDLKDFRTFAMFVKLSSEKLQEALTELEEEDNE